MTCEIVGYKKPRVIPPGFTFYSHGQQGPTSEWSTNLRAYFEKQPDYFMWIMEDTFFKEPIRFHFLNPLWFYPDSRIGRIDLTNDIQKREHHTDGTIVTAHPSSRYRLSTQPSIWCKKYLLQYLQPGMTPWEFETQDPKNDGWDVIGFDRFPITHNEGVRRFDPHKLNLEGMCDEDIETINLLMTQPI